MKIHFEHREEQGVALIEFNGKSVSVRKSETQNTFDYIPTPTGYRFLTNGKIYDVTFRTRREQEIEVFVNNRLVPLKCLDRHHFDYNGRALKEESKGDIYSVMPGRLVKLHVKTGDKVELGQPLLILEAMKMENEIKSSSSGRVKKIHVRTGDSVESHALLVSLELFEKENE